MLLFVITSVGQQYFSSDNFYRFTFIIWYLQCTSFEDINFSYVYWSAIVASIDIARKENNAVAVYFMHCELSICLKSPIVPRMSMHVLEIHFYMNERHKRR